MRIIGLTGRVPGGVGDVEEEAACRSVSGSVTGLVPGGRPVAVPVCVRFGARLAVVLCGGTRRGAGAGGGATYRPGTRTPWRRVPASSAGPGRGQPWPRRARPRQHTPFGSLPKACAYSNDAVVEATPRAHTQSPATHNHTHTHTHTHSGVSRRRSRVFILGYGIWPLLLRRRSTHRDLVEVKVDREPTRGVPRDDDPLRMLEAVVGSERIENLHTAEPRPHTNRVARQSDRLPGEGRGRTRQGSGSACGLLLVVATDRGE